ncbi:MAG: hypothetical protein MO852_15375 [Candidatus Devosia euplotis]|nr:hypothetical protein [Candidatus Devosia euplotis]
MRDLVEWIDADEVNTIASLVADLQVQHSRLTSTLADARSGGGPIITTTSLE